MCSQDYAFDMNAWAIKTLISGIYTTAWACWTPWKNHLHTLLHHFSSSPAVKSFCFFTLWPVFGVSVLILAILMSAHFNLISLLTYDVGHLFVGLFAICVPSLVKWLFRCFVHSFSQLLTFLLLNFNNSLYILVLPAFNGLFCRSVFNFNEVTLAILSLL